MLNSIREIEGEIAHVRRHLTPVESRIVKAELREAASMDQKSAGLWNQARVLAKRVPERVSRDSRHLLERIHSLAGQGCYSSSLSSLNTVRTLLDICDGQQARAPIELYVARGHIAPAFYVEYYVRGELPYILLCALHHGVTGVVNRAMGFRNTMRYSLGVGVAQAVSRAWQLQRWGSSNRVICLAGDSELQEGITYEAIGWANEKELSNFGLIVDANGKGIEPLLKPVNQDYLGALFRETSWVAEMDTASLEKAVQKVCSSKVSDVLVVSSQKGPHSFKSAINPPDGGAFSKNAGEVLSQFSKENAVGLEIVTADMAGRFGLADQVPYTNVGLRESMAIGLLSSVPQDTLKIVATDEKYYMDSVNILLELTTSIECLLLLCGKSWGVWGGNRSACNILSLVDNVRVYEPVTKAEMEAVLCRAINQPKVCHALSLLDAALPPLTQDCRHDIDGGVWLWPPRFGEDREIAVLTFGYASVLVADIARQMGLPHCHFACLEPELAGEELEELKKFDALLTVEYNSTKGGFGNFLTSRYRLPCELYGVDRDPATVVHDKQLRFLGFAADQLRRRIDQFQRQSFAHCRPSRSAVEAPLSEHSRRMS